jgi:hypothetical protein
MDTKLFILSFHSLMIHETLVASPQIEETEQKEKESKNTIRCASPGLPFNALTIFIFIH